MIHKTAERELQNLLIRENNSRIMLALENFDAKIQVFQDIQKQVLEELDAFNEVVILLFREINQISGLEQITHIEILDGIFLDRAGNKTPKAQLNIPENNILSLENIEVIRANRLI